MKKSFLNMTPAEREADLARFERGISFNRTRPMSPRNKALWELVRRGPGRPRKAEEEKASRFLVSMDPRLLELVDAFAADRRLDRSKLIALSLEAFIASDRAHRQMQESRGGSGRLRKKSA